MNIIDTHSHFNLPQFQADQHEAIARMEAKGIGTICVGIDYETSVNAVGLSEKYESIWACIGQHPTHAEQAWKAGDMEVLAASKRVVAIGECGLDYYRPEDRARKEEQAILFQQHILLSKKTGLPIMLHIRPEQHTMIAYEDALTILSEQKASSGTAHFFVGSNEIADAFLALGFYISFSGVITIAPELARVVAHVPIERILIETDAPYAAPIPYRGKRNEPAYVTHVIEKIAEIKHMTYEEVAGMVRKNTSTLFHI